MLQEVLDPQEGHPPGDYLPPTLASRPLLEPALPQNRSEGGAFQSRGTHGMI